MSDVVWQWEQRRTLSTRWRYRQEVSSSDQGWIGTLYAIGMPWFHTFGGPWKRGLWARKDVLCLYREPSGICWIRVFGKLVYTRT